MSARKEDAGVARRCSSGHVICLFADVVDSMEALLNETLNDGAMNVSGLLQPKMSYKEVEFGKEEHAYIQSHPMHKGTPTSLSSTSPKRPGAAGSGRGDKLEAVRDKQSLLLQGFHSSSVVQPNLGGLLKIMSGKVRVPPPAASSHIDHQEGTMPRVEAEDLPHLSSWSWAVKNPQPSSGASEPAASSG
eukprot:767095-Hanusia_phi.AAC.4